jgi:hypothetical protein
MIVLGIKKEEECAKRNHKFVEFENLIKKIK